jgi:triosephosphate isomerase (TIM)
MTTSKIIVGNWKMYKTVHETVAYIKALAPKVSSASASIYLAVPFPALFSAVLASEGTNLIIGAQNMHSEEEGPFTGEVSAYMLKALGVDFVLLGHSERRTHFHESDAFLHKKILRALKEGLEPILCIGEKEEERESRKTLEVLEKQISSAFLGLAKDEVKNIRIAYEPIWAIGTGKTATAMMIQETHAQIRALLKQKYDATVAHEMRILYGGSVKPENSQEILLQKDVNGALVGGASLDPNQFAQIVNHC